MTVTPVLLVILDGFGYREECEDNAICQARKPHWNFLWQKYPHSTINASETWVGLPHDQMGNSEVGHMNIGAGRVVYQDYTKIEIAIETGEFQQESGAARKPSRPAAPARCTCSACFRRAACTATNRRSTRCSSMAARGGVKNLYVHAFLDGRDTPPKSAAASLAAARREVRGARRRAASPRSAAATTRWTATSAGSA